MIDDPLGQAISACDECFRQGILSPARLEEWRTLRQRNRHLFRRFVPGDVRLLFVAESPPVSGCYFYRVPEWSQRGVPSALFWETVRALGIAPQGPRQYGRKEEYLLAFAARGLAIVDAARCPVNQLRDGEARRVILNCSRFLKAELSTLRPAHIVVIKKTNEVLLSHLDVWGWGERLVSRQPLAFPVAGNQGRFREGIDALRRERPEVAGLLGGHGSHE